MLDILDAKGAGTAPNSNLLRYGENSCTPGGGFAIIHLLGLLVAWVTPGLLGRSIQDTYTIPIIRLYYTTQKGAEQLRRFLGHWYRGFPL